MDHLGETNDDIRRAVEVRRMETVAAESTRGGISSAYSQLLGDGDRLEKTVTVLSEKLDGILSPMMDKDPVMAKASDDCYPPMSHVAADLLTFSDRIRRLNSRLTELVDRIDL